jgi:transposase InsO family protein
MPKEGCRKIAAAFNRLNAHKGQTVGKSFVAEVSSRNALQIQRLRNRLKNRTRREGPRGLVYALDLTFVRKDVAVLGILDHGTRALLSLSQLKDRTTIGVLRVLLDVIERFGKPRFIRTDNEKIFTSSLMRLALPILGIRPQTTDPFCPWQNGRVERIFWTLKQRLYAWWETAGVPDDVRYDLDTFRTWYNHARVHQSLAGITPAMAWAGVAKTGKRPRFFEAWDRILTGFVSPR